MADGQQPPSYAYNAAGETVSPQPGAGAMQPPPQQIQPGATGPPQAYPGPYTAYPQAVPGVQPQPVQMQPGYAAVPGQPMMMQQPVIQWMAPPPSVPGVPPGLEYLTQIDQLLIHQQIEIMELMTGFEMCNKYQIKNSLGQLVYFATEESGCCMRQCCGNNRGFVMHIANNFNQEVIRLVRDFKCCAGCCWCACSSCCSMDVSIEAPVGQVVGYVRQLCSGWNPKYAINNAKDETIFVVDGPCCPCQCICCPRDIEFPVTTYDGGQEIGKITKQWAGFVREYFTSADQFGVSFPMDLDVNMKAVLLGGVFLIDFMYFEQNNKKQH